MFDTIVVYLTLIFILFSFYKEWAGTSFTFLIAVVILAVCGILTPSEVLAGMANEQVVVVILLLLLGDIIREVGVIESLFDRIFIKTQRQSWFMTQMMFIVGLFSAFFNNTPLVAVMMPYVTNWGKKNSVPASKLLIPLSYAAILGGSITLIGTSTNLIVDGMAVENLGIELGMFDFMYVGLPMLFIGIAYVVFFGPKLLPSKEGVFDEAKRNTREYFAEALIAPKSSFVGKTLKETGFLEIKGLFLFEVYRDGTKIAIEDTLSFAENDRLMFTGDTEKIAELLNNNQNLVVPEIEATPLNSRKTKIVEVVISHNSTLISKNSKEVNFRSKYGAALIAIHRNGAKIREKLRDVRLKAGDVLLLATDNYFAAKLTQNNNMYLISDMTESKKLKPYVTWLLVGGILISVILSACKLAPLFTSLAVVLVVILGFRITNPKDIAGKVDFNLGITIVLALAYGLAMMKTGVATSIANAVIFVFEPLGLIGLLFGLYILTGVLAAYITNKAAVAVAFPIAISLAKQLGANPEPFILLVAFASAANFMTPIGYQTNLMIYGPGGYNFKDFFKIGFPLTVIYMLVCVCILYTFVEV